MPASSSRLLGTCYSRGSPIFWLNHSLCASASSWTGWLVACTELCSADLKEKIFLFFLGTCLGRDLRTSGAPFQPYLSVKLLLLPGTISVFRRLWTLVDVNWSLAYSGASLRRIAPGVSFGLQPWGTLPGLLMLALLEVDIILKSSGCGLMCEWENNHSCFHLLPQYF